MIEHPDDCPRCRGDSRIIQSRRALGARRRRHQCKVCGHLWTAYEVVLRPGLSLRAAIDLMKSGI